ncbi:hypothetical protein BDQ12DRAFT_736708 [Crucibulum laeve]|uniref:DUF6593 domain-containing protein n=1 Tax=Crucibulum laeve TaxID=68775 RepID=A0A5C3LVG6_9AGAR|nr:hypothetical protein BDQ12DRAFT_736708 [Crucibulum laeve]
MIISPDEQLPDNSLVKSTSTLTLNARSPPPVHPAMQYQGTSALPPGYTELGKPTTNITYTCSPQTIPANSMIVTPPAYVNSLQKPYFISVNMNCFTPTSYITTIRRGSWDGELVGDFEMGLTTSRKPATICLRGNEQPLSEGLESNYRIFHNMHQSWTWKVSEYDKTTTIFWEETPGPGLPLTCFSSKEKVVGNILARFLPPRHPRKQGRPSDSTRLEVTPYGHEFIDDIVMSALIIERIRTAPSAWALPF